MATGSEQRSVHLAIDGKVLKGTGKQAYGGEKPQRHVLHVHEVQTGIVPHQCPIQEKKNEVSALKPLLTEALCKGRVITADLDGFSSGRQCGSTNPPLFFSSQRGFCLVSDF
ncbi:MAG TPA: hypothetical protein VFV38_18715 [Ktedonobacteraceae bacterium]|nr:hypothetical protein [Ktedonobacteraceae bacterium]